MKIPLGQLDFTERQHSLDNGDNINRVFTV